MKLVLSLVAALTMTACASSPTKTAEAVQAPQPSVTMPSPQPVVRAPVPRPYAMSQRQAQTMVQAPGWFVTLPEDTEDMTFAAGTATSNDEQMAYDKARMSAERKLVEQMYARITTQTNSYRAERSQAMVENYQQVTRKNARGELSGAQRVDSQVTHDGYNYKVYVLLRLPTGQANSIQTRRDQTRLQREGDIRSRAAERDMDKNETADTKREQDVDQTLERSLSPQSRVFPVVVPDAKTSEIKLLDVDNEEYKRKRDEALAKPGAVIGQITVR